MSDTELLTESACARYADISLNAMRYARQRGKITPKQEMLTGIGVVRLYDPAEVKAFFENDPEFLANRARCRRKVAAVADVALG